MLADLLRAQLRESTRAAATARQKSPNGQVGDSFMLAYNARARSPLLEIPPTGKRCEKKSTHPVRGAMSYCAYGISRV